MVFRFENGIATVAGKELVLRKDDSNMERLGKHLQLTKHQIRQQIAPEHRQEALHAIEPTPDALTPAEPIEKYPDPYPTREALEEMPVYERQRIVHDQGGYVDAWLGQLAVIAEERAELDAALADPRWTDHPSRPEGLTRRAEYSVTMADLADSIAWAEAWADRCWQTLTEPQRLTVNHMWLTSEKDDRLVTRAWRDQAQFGWTWPKGLYVESAWFEGLPNRLHYDLRPLWANGPTWLGEPVELDTAADKQFNEEFVRHIKSMMS